MSNSAYRSRFLLIAMLCLVTGGMMLTACRSGAEGGTVH